MIRTQLKQTNQTGTLIYVDLLYAKNSRSLVQNKVYQNLPPLLDFLFKQATKNRS